MAKKANEIKIIISGLLMLCGVTIACHPQCSYVCDDPVCPAVCKVIASPPNCSWQCSNNYIPRLGSCDSIRCRTRAPVDVCEMEGCPQVETICMPSVCRALPQGISCSINCRAPVSSWICRNPTYQECPPPRCEITCEDYACKSTITNDSSQTFLGVFSFVIVLVINIYL